MSSQIRDDMVSAALGFLKEKDQLEEDLGKSAIASVGTKAVVATATASGTISMQQVEILERLKALGYGPKSDVAKNLIANTNEINSVLNGMARKIGSIL
jgi:hypothetical protein